MTTERLTSCDGCGRVHAMPAEGSDADRRRRLHEAITWLESFQRYESVGERPYTAAAMESLNMIAPDNLCLHMDHCPDWKHIDG